MTTSSDSPTNKKRAGRPIISKAISVLVVVVSYSVFYGAAVDRGLDWGNTAKLFLFLSPCAIFGITTFVYYRFVTSYSDDVAGLSLLGLFAALFGCIKLSAAPANDWAAHLKWMYFLFYSYVLWDCVMLAWFIPESEQDPKKTAKHASEIAILSTHINQPTLLAIFFMWILSHKLASEVAGSYVDGVVAFHLVFATIACGRTMLYWLKEW